jgi:hypothetical protein
MPPKKNKKSGTEGQQNSKVEHYKHLKNYKMLKLMDNEVSKNIETIYNNNRWDLVNKFDEVKQHYLVLNLKYNEIAWLNKIQYLDIPNGTDLTISQISLQSLIKGEYKSVHTDKKPNSLTTEKKYGKRVVFWTNNFHSLKKYKDVDDLQWVVHENNTLLYEMMKYNNDAGNTPSALHGDLKTITRVIKLLLGPEHELTYKYGALQIAMKDVYDYCDTTNIVATERELKSFVKYEQLLDILVTMENKYKEMVSKLPSADRKNGLKHSDGLFQLHQMILALSLYIYTFPSRHENLDLDIITDEKEAKSGKNYVLINLNGVSSIIYNEIVKTHQPHKYTLASKQLLPFHNKLNTLLKNTLKMYPRPFLFIPKNTWSGQVLKKVGHETVSEWLRDLVKDKNINISGMRSAFASYWIDIWNTRQLTICAAHMRTSVDEIMKAYRKKFNNPEDLMKIKIDPDIELQAKTNVGQTKETGFIVGDDNIVNEIIRDQPLIVKEKSIIININEEKKNTDGLNKFQRYLTKPGNKDKHNDKVKQYGKETNNIARRYVRELNNKTQPFDTMRKSTIDKYKIKCNDNGIYYSELLSNVE